MALSSYYSRWWWFALTDTGQRAFRLARPRVWQDEHYNITFAGFLVRPAPLLLFAQGAERPLVQNPWPADFKSLLRSSWQRDPDKRPSFREIHAVLSGMYSEMNTKKKGGFFGKK
ncbi:unnamed protein product [Ectocarpus sp. CCAP 1310/34]|nr:unnamed protein product [Ectocarpus sp. CCAP 1310/34]